MLDLPHKSLNPRSCWIFSSPRSIANWHMWCTLWARCAKVSPKCALTSVGAPFSTHSLYSSIDLSMTSIAAGMAAMDIAKSEVGASITGIALMVSRSSITRTVSKSSAPLLNLREPRALADSNITDWKTPERILIRVMVPSFMVARVSRRLIWNWRSATKKAANIATMEPIACVQPAASPDHNGSPSARRSNSTPRNANAEIENTSSASAQPSNFRKVPPLAKR